jgi:hypothetical protein
MTYFFEIKTVFPYLQLKSLLAVTVNQQGEIMTLADSFGKSKIACSRFSEVLRLAGQI